MADIVIRGYKMPCNCGGCEFFLENSLGAKWCEIKFTPTEEAGRPSWCPLIALPEGHGRLIDASKLMKHYAWWGENDEQRELFDEIIDQQETIVPAEEEDT